MSHNPLDGAALRRLFERENAVLVRFLAGLTRCRVAAEDVAQMAWLKLINAMHGGACVISHEPELRAYLFTVARNTFIDECTRKREVARSRATDPADLAEMLARSAVAPSAEEELERAQTRAVLLRAIESLPDRQREVVLMWCAGESTKSMARETAAPYDTVLSRKKYALSRIRAALAADAQVFE